MARVAMVHDHRADTFAACPTDPAIGSNPCFTNNSINWTAIFGFKSLHPGGAQFVLGDGLVGHVPETIYRLTYDRLGDKADGGVIGAH